MVCESKERETSFVVVVKLGEVEWLVMESAMSTSPEHIGEYVDDAFSFAGELEADSSDSGGDIVNKDVP